MVLKDLSLGFGWEAASPAIKPRVNTLVYQPPFADQNHIAIVFAAISAYPHLIKGGSSIPDRILIFHNLFHNACKVEPMAKPSLLFLLYNFLNPRLVVRT